MYNLLMNHYAGPPQDPKDQQNLIIASLLIFGVFIVWNYLYPAPVPEPRRAPEQIQSAAGDARMPSMATQTHSATPSLARPETKAEALSTSARVRINTDALHGSIALKGLRFDDVTLADYHETIDPTSPEVTLLTPNIPGAGYFAEFGWAGDGTETPNASTMWQTTDTELRVNRPVTFFWENAAGVRFEHIISVDDAYLFSITKRVMNQSAQPITLAPYSLINRTMNEEPEQFFILHQGPLGVSNDVLHEPSYEDLRDGRMTHEHQDGWSGITDKYWLTALLPDPAYSSNTTTNYHAYRTGSDQRYQVDMLAEPITVAAGTEATHVTHFFAGAKKVDLLDGYSEQLQLPLFDRAIDFGMLYFLTRPIFEGLQGLHALLGNFGLSILALTILVKLLMFPLANKSYASMSQMKLLMPKMQEIRERYEDDRVQMNQEIMAMYKKEGVNPASGCLPLLLQIPVFFALYKVLFITIEMRHAPFYGWIEDLSVKDPTNIFTLFGTIPWDAPSFLHVGAWPLIMTVTMVIQQRLNPKPADPTQAQVMAFLPYMFLFLFATFPAGLVIYWAWNNTLSIIQQYVITRRYAKLYDKETGKRIKPSRSK